MNSNEIIKALKCKSTGERDCEDNNCKYKQVDGECDLDLLHCDTVNIIESLKTQLETKRIYSAEESTSLMNKYIMNPYKGLVTCKEPLLGKTICETLAQFEEEFDVRLHAVCG